MNNILVIKLRYLGDVLLATPTLKAVKASWPAARLTMLVNRGTEEVVTGNPNVDEVLVLDRGPLASQYKFAMAVRRRKYDLVIDLTDADRSAFLSWLSGAPMRIGFNVEQRSRGFCYTTVVRPGPDVVHRVDRDCAALGPLGIRAKPDPPEMWINKQDHEAAEELLRRLEVDDVRPIAVLQPGARYWFKAWPPERFARLADHLAETHGHQVLIAGSGQERQLAKTIRDAAKSRPAVMVGEATVKQFAAVLKRAVLLVGNDSGAMHIAAAMGTPVVALFGPSNPMEWGPRGGPVEILYKGLDCRACFHPTCRRGEENCMRLISVEEVCFAVTKILGK